MSNTCECGKKTQENRKKCESCRRPNRSNYRAEVERRYRATQKGAYNRMNYELGRKYGITLEEYAHLENNQNHSCATCGSSDTRLVLDHCHDTGKVRGLLCDPCNLALGKVKDNTQTLTNMIKYLEQE